jgi:hypothetical protein
VSIGVGLNNSENPRLRPDAFPDKSKISLECAEVDFDPCAEVIWNKECGHMMMKWR